MREGYLTLATGDQKYVAMAANLAASVKTMDPTRRICLVHDIAAGPAAEHARFFDDLVFLDPDPRYPHVMNKLRLFRASPYERSMFVDADCLLVKRDVDRYWDHARRLFFCITGAPQRRGEWKGVRLEEIVAARALPYIVQMNAGVFFFDKSEAAARFFAEFEDFYQKEFETLAISNYRGANSHSFELYLGIFLGMKGLASALMPNFGNESWMVSTWRAPFCRFDIASGRSEIFKLGRFLFGLPVLPTSITRLSPTFAHFIGLKPRATYERLAGEFRRRAGGCA
ncbi:hypothetical protein FK498_12340 [Elioraea sp. Yellowstone]|jgi:hypothetical protein|uniref:hypothetical protein n=1 Tax=Elioraea sp. Yellowstone TaxID=2592070 RepID=UPI0011548A3C|nr:hypothetical protein [Elioraea sp. Yellowstone]TQF77508.1 hypothetical protein FK498_12340 [Elioraea sp. Yellowstone]